MITKVIIFIPRLFMQSGTGVFRGTECLNLTAF